MQYKGHSSCQTGLEAGKVKLLVKPLQVQLQYVSFSYGSHVCYVKKHMHMTKCTISTDTEAHSTWRDTHTPKHTPDTPPYST